MKKKVLMFSLLMFCLGTVGIFFKTSQAIGGDAEILTYSELDYDCSGKPLDCVHLPVVY